MKNLLTKKGIALTVIVLFVAASIVPSIGGDIGKIRNVSENIREQESFSGDPPDEQWNKTFGGSDSDCGSSVQQTSDGGYIITGYTDSYGAGENDVWLIKTDADGDEEWNKTFGGREYDVGRSVQQTIDGGYIITGETMSYGVGADAAWLIKTDADGDEEWNKTFGGTNSDCGNSVQQTTDGGYIITGVTMSYGAGGSGVWLIKTDSSGNEQWNTTFGETGGGEVGKSVQQTIDGGYIITGKAGYPGAQNFYDVWLIKTDSNGDEEWNKTFGGTDWDSGRSVQQASDSGYIITGEKDRYGSYGKLWLIKTDDDGNEEWNKTFGGREYDVGRSVQQTSDGGYIITGYTDSYGAGENDVWLIKTDADGDEEWNRTFGGINYDYGLSGKQTSDGGYIITGCTDSYGLNVDVWLIKVAAENQPPSVEIVNPKEGYFHFSGIPLFPTALDLLADTASFGGFRLKPIQVNATDDNDETEELLVSLYIDDEDKGYGTWNPETGYYEWKWTGWTLGIYTLKVKAKDVYGAESDWAILDVWNFCFIP